MKNYRVQDGCWNCLHCEIPYTEGYFVCHLEKEVVAPYGICDLYEKEEA